MRKPADTPSAYWPICLLDDVAKLFEQMLAARIVHHLSGGDPDLAECQHGFREGQFTLDAIIRVKSLSKRAVSRSRMALAISLDIVNAFSTLPWECIERALVYHRVPAYLRGMIGVYLKDRWITYTGRDGTQQRREVRCGVPQGSAFRLLQWNIDYNAVLRA